MIIKDIVDKQRAFFDSQQTKSVEYRIAALNRLEKAILNNIAGINAALMEDLCKSKQETYMTEIGMALSELRYMRKHLNSWARLHYVSTPLAQFPSVSLELMEPYGVALIMSPWNYPFLLCIEPAIAAIAAGNCCILKPSAYSPATSDIIDKIIKESFSAEYVTVVKGGRDKNTELLEQRFDYIFFTGGVNVGRLVMEKASRYVTPHTLELGGKSPCIVDATANVAMAARRIAFGKCLNSGQTCVAPDYLLIHESVKEEFVECYKEEVTKMLGNSPLENSDYPKIINEKHFDRIIGLMEGENVVFGGCHQRVSRKIEPTLLDNITFKSRIMQEEIFGPVLPMITFTDIRKAKTLIQKREKPLALYLFTEDKYVEQMFLKEVSFGGGCINDTIIHLASEKLAFGGVGMSGMGNYHGKYGFETFSHRKSVVKKSSRIDIPMRYHPYSNVKLALIKKFM